MAAVPSPLGAIDVLSSILIGGDCSAGCARSVGRDDRADPPVEYVGKSAGVRHLGVLRVDPRGPSRWSRPAQFGWVQVKVGTEREQQCQSRRASASGSMAME